ncbi:hypothetical protein SAMN04487904_107116 [Actinopolyspora lacussalsi subsp. righensis]|uniref:Uncharacterized protein n=1 Tax=Actinopolyspora righensis TaxID=995060 RepID=A0A1I7AJ84_9ACTN|nr:hypothetical protein SAMN04487904_107116 [Actinopolyspora righensis]
MIGWLGLSDVPGTGKTHVDQSTRQENVSQPSAHLRAQLGEQTRPSLLPPRKARILRPHTMQLCGFSTWIGIIDFARSETLLATLVLLWASLVRSRLRCTVLPP